MKALLILVLILLNLHYSSAQIFKKQIKKQPSALDKIKINEHFRLMPLDSVYNFLGERYGLKIIYDTAYCNSILFDYCHSISYFFVSNLISNVISY